MNKLNYEILSAIDNIDSTIMESEMNVMNSLINTYDKAVMILEHCDDNSDVSSYDIFQESVIMEADNNGNGKTNNKKKNIIKNMINKIIDVVKKLPSFIKTFYNDIKRIKAEFTDKYYYFPRRAISDVHWYVGSIPDQLGNLLEILDVDKLLKYDCDQIKAIRFADESFTHYDDFIEKMKDSIKVAINDMKNPEYPSNVSVDTINEIIETFDCFFGHLRKHVDQFSELMSKFNHNNNNENEQIYDVLGEHIEIVKMLWHIASSNSVILNLLNNLFLEIINHPASKDDVKKKFKTGSIYSIF